MQRQSEIWKYTSAIDKYLLTCGHLLTHRSVFWFSIAAIFSTLRIPTYCGDLLYPACNPGWVYPWANFPHQTDQGGMCTWIFKQMTTSKKRSRNGGNDIQYSRHALPISRHSTSACNAVSNYMVGLTDCLGISIKYQVRCLGICTTQQALQLARVFKVQALVRGCAGRRLAVSVHKKHKAQVAPRSKKC